MKILQTGRSMIEMLGVLAIIGVLSIGGLLGYRRAVNNHQANQILDDVNRFAFVILERSGLALDAEIGKGDFVESGIYTLEGYQDIEPEQFSITVFDVPRGVCEALLSKAAVEYAVRVKEHGSNDGPLYDSKHQDLCQNTNDIVLYFGDTSDLCYPADVSAGETRCNDCRCDGYCVVDSVTGEDVCCPAGQKAANGVCTAGATGQPCTTNANCTAGEFCLFSYYENNGAGICTNLANYSAERVTLSNGQTWAITRKRMFWDGAQNWCNAQKLKPAARSDFNCTSAACISDTTKTCCFSDVATSLQKKWGSGAQAYWLEVLNTYWKTSYTIMIASNESRPSADGNNAGDGHWPLCVTQ